MLLHSLALQVENRDIVLVESSPLFCLAWVYVLRWCADIEVCEMEWMCLSEERELLLCDLWMSAVVTGWRPTSQREHSLPPV